MNSNVTSKHSLVTALIVLITRGGHWLYIHCIIYSVYRQRRHCPQINCSVSGESPMVTFEAAETALQSLTVLPVLTAGQRPVSRLAKRLDTLWPYTRPKKLE